MRRGAVLAASAIAVLAPLGRASAQAAPDDSRPYAARADSIARLDPAAEVRKAIARHDYRLIGVCGYACVPAGVQERARACGVLIIRGTSDAPPNRAAVRLDAVAARYAERYDAAMLDYLRRTGTRCGSR